MRKVNFFIVGAPRSGSTSIYTYLSSHPEVFMAKPKVPNHFCTDLIRESKLFAEKRNILRYADEKTYQNLFTKVKNQKIIGEASITYLYSKEAAKNIFNYNPESKILILVRDPVEFMFSLYSEYVFDLHENVRSFEKALSLERIRKKGHLIPHTAQVPSLLFYSERAKFSEQINRYFLVFPKKNIKIILFDDLKTKIEEVYVDLLNFLSISCTEIPEFKVHNPYRTPKFGIFQKLAFDPDLPFKNVVRTLIPRKVQHFFLRKLIRFNKKETKKPDMDMALKNKLKKQFKPEVIKLSRMLSRDLVELWGY